MNVVLPKGVYSVSGETAIFSIHDKKDYEIHEIVQQVYDALKEKGYNPVNQLVGYILSEDPTYITTYKNARSMIRKVDRDDLLQAMLLVCSCPAVAMMAGLFHNRMQMPFTVTASPVKTQFRKIRRSF